jgi:hypothetical protein
MITTNAVPVPQPHHHWRVAQLPTAIKNDFADPLGCAPFPRIFTERGRVGRLWLLG